ncbi:MAG: hypothetical protein KDB14_18190 [Planctomycetales bacterium]|nr:hypothetical protein [Planctomycetales bacterium]
MKRFGSIAVVAIVTLLVASTADARPQYLKAATAHYPAAASALGEAKCGACHGEKKSMLSTYAMALKEATGKNQKDADKINEALDKAGAKKNDDGVTYESLFKAGKLPKPYTK